MSHEHKSSKNRPCTFTARWIFPVDRPPIERGVLTIEGSRIVSVGPGASRAADIDFGETAILPGLVNAHTHLDLTGLRGQAQPSHDFTGWLRQVIAHRRNRSPDRVAGDIADGIAECARYGTTMIGDISGDGTSWQPLRLAPLRALVYREVLGLPADRASAALDRFHDWYQALEPGDTCRPGISPHAPYSVRTTLFAGAASLSLPITTHLAETTDEIELLEEHTGPFVAFLQELGVWDPDGLAESVDHIVSMLHSSGGKAPLLIAHGNYLTPSATISANDTIVYCPRTHAAFGHPPHPFREFLARGIRVALGTDSLASNPDLNLFAEAQYLHDRYPDLDGATLLRMATLSGAEGLGRDEEAGSLTPGKSADFVVLALEPGGADPYRRLFAGRQPVRATYFRGVKIGGARAEK